jgi:hypothetical protein
MAEYHDTSSPLNQNISALVPSELSNPPSITKYLGVKDWYAMNFLSNCSGFFVPSAVDPSLLTSTKVNITCTSQSAGYIFYLDDILHGTLNPSVQDLASEMAFNVKNYNTGPWNGLWIAGIINSGLTFIAIPFTFSGTGRLNGYAFLTSWVSISLSQRQ